jgi:uncharacterized membrane protein YbhN (UPF0104 family)
MPDYKPYFKFFLYLIILIIFSLVSYKLYEDWASVTWNDIHVKSYWLIFAFFMVVIVNLLQIYIWKKILSIFNFNISFISSFRIEMISQVGKYIPGKVGLVLTKFVECNRLGIPRKVSLIAASYHIGIGLYFQFLIGLLTIPVIYQTVKDNNIAFSVLYLVSIILIGLIFVYPNSFIFFINIFLRLTGKETIKVQFKIFNWVCICFAYLLLAILGGFFGFLIINTFFPVAFNKIPYIIGTMSWAFLIGLLNVFAPSGIGVRDGILIGLYSYIIPAPIALVVAITTRIIGTSVEWLLIGIAFYIKPVKMKIRDK